MDSHAALCQDEADELDLTVYPAAHGPSLLEVATAGTAQRLARLRKASATDVVNLSLPALLVIGLSGGVALGLLLI
jgi:hypothetical protein